MEKLLTIVIAAYNMEGKLPRCLNSLVVNTELQELLQVLVINDGSKDNTLKIAREYESRFPNLFEVVDQANGNYGKVMNNGLSLAKGKYFRTLDADDWYDTKSFSEFLKDLRNSDADMIVTQRLEYIETIQQIKQVKKRFDESVVTYKDISVSEVDWRNVSVQDNLNVPHITYKTKIIKESGLKWIEGICYTDTMYDYWPLRLVKTVRFVPLNVYTYLIGTNEQSMSSKNIRKNFLHFAKVAEAIGRDFKINGDIEASIFPAQEKFIIQIMNFVYNDLNFGDENKDRIVEIHNLYSSIPYFKHLFENRTFCRLRYLQHFSDGSLPLSYMLLRRINKLSGYKIKKI